MKSFKRMFAKQSTRHLSESGSSNDPPRQSSARRRSTERQTQPENRTISSGEYKRLVDNELHVSNPTVEKLKSGNYFAIRSMWHTANELYVTLSQNDEVKRLIDNSGWSGIFSKHMPKSDRGVVEACIRRWWDTTHTFHLPTCEIGLTPFDFTMITGISIGGKLDLPSYSDGDLLEDTKKTLDTYFPYLEATIDSGCIRASDIVKYLTSDGITEIVEPVHIARAFCFYVLGYVFFPNASSTCQVGMLNYLNDMERIGDFDWGSAILGRIYHCLDAVCRRKIKSLNCFWQVIEYFYYEYFGTTCPVLKEPLVDTWPRIHRWIKVNYNDRSKNAVRFNYDIANQQLEMRSMQSIIWQLYVNSVALQAGINVMSFNMSRFRFLLLDPELGATWYLGDRCYKQIYGALAIPNDPPAQMGNIPRELYVALSQAEWTICTHYINQATVEQYTEYWAAVSRGPYLAALSRGVNTDIVGLHDLVGNEVQLPCTPHELQGKVYDTQSASTSSQPSEVDWTYQICTPSGETITLPFDREATNVNIPPAMSFSRGNWRAMYTDALIISNQLRSLLLANSTEMSRQLRERDAELEILRGTCGYRPTMNLDNTANESYSQWPGLDDN